MDHTLAFVELAPDRYATIRDIYLPHRDEKRARTGRHNAVWEGLPDGMAATGLSLPAFSNELMRMSIVMFVRHPLLYADRRRPSMGGLLARPHVLAAREPPLLPSVGRFVQLGWRLEQPMVRLANLIFLGLVAGGDAGARAPPATPVGPRLTTLAAIVLLTSIVQALAIGSRTPAMRFRCNRW